MASGCIVYDDGISLEAVQSKKYIQIDIFLNSTKIEFKTVNNFDTYYNNDIIIDSITIYRGKRWTEFMKIEAKSSEGEIIVLKTNYDLKN